MLEQQLKSFHLLFGILEQQNVFGHHAHACARKCPKYVFLLKGLFCGALKLDTEQTTVSRVSVCLGEDVAFSRLQDLILNVSSVLNF